MVESLASDWTMQLLAGHATVKYWLGDRGARRAHGMEYWIVRGAGKYDLQFFDKDGEQGDFFDAGIQEPTPTRSANASAWSTVSAWVICKEIVRNMIKRTTRCTGTLKFSGIHGKSKDGNGSGPRLRKFHSCGC